MRVAFLGDSLTAGWLTEGAPFWDTRYQPAGVKNFGVPGDRTDDVLVRIQQRELDRADPELVVLLIGANDLGSGRSPAVTVRGVQACIVALRERYPAAVVLLLGLLPRGDGGGTGYAMVAAVNEGLRELADGEAVRFHDLGAAFMEPNGRLRADLYAPDMLHLAEAGYGAWSEALDGVLSAFGLPPARPPARKVP